MLVHPNPDPVAFSIGPVDIHWYGLMYVVAFALFMMLGRVRIKQPHIAAQGWKNEDLDDMLFYGMLGVVIGGRLGEVLFYQPAYFFAHPLEIFKVWQGGMSFHGGFLGVLIAMALWARKARNLLDVYDFIAPMVPLGYAAGRLGNFINPNCRAAWPTRACRGPCSGRASKARAIRRRSTRCWSTASWCS
jgi:phosphatidylglycerol:prolipoprotein diacylglycerol transferase